ncbi:MAG: helix-turn-helix domain-containing protein [Actinomycetota bacterium]
MDRLVLTPSEVGKALGISRGLAYTLIREGRIPSIRLGAKRLVVSRESLEQFLAMGTDRESQATGANP